MCIRDRHTLYFNNPDGLSGNEDCGQMSAWYILNAMGFYQVCPGKPVYSIGRPLFNEEMCIRDRYPTGRVPIQVSNWCSRGILPT